MSRPPTTEAPLRLGTLEAFLDEHGLGHGPVEAEPVGEGHSNLTFLLRRGGEEWILRRPPLGPLPPSAHDVLREHRLLAPLADTPVRTPRPLAACADESVIGAPFYVMEKVTGDVVGHRLPAWLDEAARPRVAFELVDALAELHAVDWRACGLEGYGRPDGYLERQVRRFSGLWEVNRTRELPVVERAGEWLRANIPASPPATIVHGEYRLGNVVLDPASSRLVAILDWELSTIGDPFADVGYLTAAWADRVVTQVPALGQHALTCEPGFPSRDELVARYEERTGWRVPSLRWHWALALWKAAVFFEGSYRRWLAGTTEDAFFATLGKDVPRLAELALEVAHGTP